MKKIVWAILATVAGVVLLFSYRTSLGQGTTASPLITGKTGFTSAPSATPSTAASPGTAATAGAPASAAPPAASSTGLKDGSFSGQTADTPYGPLRVQIVVSSGVITTVKVPVYPSGSGRDQEINSFALPQLVQETVSAQSANIDMVSGATFTSQGYLQSLQSAIDKAKA